MKASFLILIIVFTSLYVFVDAQPGFNILRDAGFDNNHLRDMIIVNDTIVGYGMGFDNPVNGKQGLILVKFDTNGVLLNAAIILDSFGSALSIDKNWGKIIAASDGGFAMTASPVSRNSTILIKMTNDFEIEFIKEYIDTLNISSFFSKPIEIDDGYFLYGNVQQPNLILRSYVRKVDDDGNTVWLKYFGVENWNNLFIKGEQIGDSLFVFGGVQSGSTLEQGVSVLKFIDEDGNVVRDWSSETHPEMGFLRNFQVMGDGSIIVFGQYLVEETGINSGFFQTALSKLNSDLDYEWVKRFGKIENSVLREMFWDIEAFPDSSFIGAGQSRVDINGKNEPSGWLMKFDAEGDSIWSRYDFPDFPVDSLGDTFFGGVGVLSSGSIVAGGTATLWNKDAIWLVKVTNDGCLDTIFCGLVPTEFTPSPDKRQLTMFPNPANESLTIQFGNTSKTPTVIEFYNIQGQRVLQRNTGIGLSEVTITTIDLPEGFYLVKVGSEGAFQIGKVFINH